MTAEKKAASMTLLDQALALAAEGYRVFPLIVGGKTPAIKGFPHRASCDPTAVRTMWRHQVDPVLGVERFEPYNIGIATGGGFGGRADRFLTVMDVDVKAGAKGLDSLAALEMFEGGDWYRETKRVDTPSSGFHCYFVGDQPLRGTASTALGDGIDTRGVGGYVVAEGSITEKGAYRRSNDLRPQAVAPWLADQIGAPIDRNVSSNVVCLLDAEANVRRGVEWLKTQAPHADQGNRKNTAYRVACKMRDFGISALTAQELMAEHWNDDHCSPPMEFAYMAVPVENAYTYAKLPGGNLDPEADFEPVTPEEKAEAEAASADPFGVSHKKAPPKPTFPLEFFGDIEIDLSEVDLIKGFIMRQGTMVIAGAPNAGKSLLEAHLAHTIASGGSWCGMKTLQGMVLCALGEGRRGFRRRLKAIRDAFPHTKDAPLAHMPVPNLGSEESVSAFIDACKAAVELKGVPLRMVFLDTLTTAMPGMDQNATDGMGLAVASMRRIADALDCVVCSIHHVGKDAAKGIRGSSVLTGDVDTALLIESTDRGEFKVSDMKQRDFEKGHTFMFKIKGVSIGEDPDGEDVSTAFAEWDEANALEADFCGKPMPTKAYERTMLKLIQCAPFDSWIQQERLVAIFTDLWTTEENPGAIPRSVRKNAGDAIRALVEGKFVDRIGERNNFTVCVAPAMRLKPEEVDIRYAQLFMRS